MVLYVVLCFEEKFFSSSVSEKCKHMDGSLSMMIHYIIWEGGFN